MKLIVLDRDGVINQDSDDYIKSPEEWQPIEGSLEAIARLHQAGYTIAVTTNQSGIGRGFYDHETLAAMHNKFHRLLSRLDAKVEAIFYCPHTPEDGCNCRKPKPGLFERVATTFQTDLSGVPAIGDSFRDHEAALAVGARPIAVKTGKGLRTLESKGEEMRKLQIPVFDDLAAAVNAILNHEV